LGVCVESRGVKLRYTVTKIVTYNSKDLFNTLSPRDNYETPKIREASNSKIFFRILPRRKKEIFLLTNLFLFQKFELFDSDLE